MTAKSDGLDELAQATWKSALPAPLEPWEMAHPRPFVPTGTSFGGKNRCSGAKQQTQLQISGVVSRAQQKIFPRCGVKRGQKHLPD